MLSGARFVGVDPRRDLIETSVQPTGQLWTTDAGDDGMAQVAETVSNIQPQVVVMQANGNFELPMAGILVTCGLPVALVLPRNLREFARAIGRSPRPDQAQSGLLAKFAELVQPEATTLPEEAVEELRQLRRRRQEILQMIGLERTRSGSGCPALEKDVQSHIQFLEKSLILIDAQFSRKVRISRLWL